MNLDFIINAGYVICFSILCLILVIVCSADWLRNKAMMTDEEKEDMMRETQVTEEDLHREVS